MKIGFLVEVLPEQPKRQLEDAEAARILIRRVDAKRLLLIPAPDRRAGSVGDKPWRVEMIGVTSEPDAMLPYR